MKSTRIRPGGCRSRRWHSRADHLRVSLLQIHPGERAHQPGQPLGPATTRQPGQVAGGTPETQSAGRGQRPPIGDRRYLSPECLHLAEKQDDRRIVHPGQLGEQGTFPVGIAGGDHPQPAKIAPVPVNDCLRQLPERAGGLLGCPAEPAVTQQPGPLRGRGTGQPGGTVPTMVLQGAGHLDGSPSITAAGQQHSQAEQLEET